MEQQGVLPVGGKILVHPIVAGHDTDLGCNGHPVDAGADASSARYLDMSAWPKAPFPPHPPKSMLYGRFDPNCERENIGACSAATFSRHTQH